MHALIIEGECFITLMIENALRDLGYSSFDFVTSIDLAVAAARARRPDLITSDIRFGAETPIAALIDHAGRRVPVVFVTAIPWEGEKGEWLTVVPKPFDEERLKAEVIRVTCRG